ncbi:MAG TPA: cytochrome c [Kofleriaceae bacterium]
MASKHSTWQNVTVKPWLLLVFVVACDKAGAGSGTDGAQLYQSTCAMCHGPKGKPSEAMVARLNVRDLTSQELRARITPALVEAQIRNGSQNKLMPSFEGALNDEQIKALAAYVASASFLQQ